MILHVYWCIVSVYSGPFQLEYAIKTAEPNQKYLPEYSIGWLAL